MSQVRTLTSSFTGGEIAPELAGRIDLARYRNSVAKVRNLVVTTHGPVENRAGTQFVREVKTSANATRLIPFSYNNAQTFAIEIGAGYFRWHTQGGTLESTPGVAYELANTFTTAELFDIHYTQSADVLTLVHPNHPPAELRRVSATVWTYTNITVAPTLPAPAQPTVVATYATPGVPKNFKYAIAAVTATDSESYASVLSVAVVNDLTKVGNFNTISWTTVTGAFQYEVYKESNGLLGLIGRTDGAVLTFVDDNIVADLGQPPNLVDVTFSATGDYPSAVGYYEQRRIFAGTTNSPQGVWMTRPGTESDMAYTIPSRDDNALRFRVKALKAGTIRHVIPSQAIVLLTADTEFRATATNGGAITPSTLTVKPQAYIGASNVQPAIANNNIIYAAQVGGRMRELAYTSQSTAFPQYNSYDLSILAPHLFDGFTIADIAYARAPYPVCWCVSSTGKLLGATYLPEQEVLAWHQHDTTNGAFESICVVTESQGDVIYAIVRRTIGGVTKRYVERIHTRDTATVAAHFFVDCGGTYSGAATNTVTGLTWLEGQTVVALCDGRVETGLVVTSGVITLSAPASLVHVGLPITAELETLPPALELPGLGTGRVKNINAVYLRVVRTGAFQVGSSATSDLTSVPPDISDTYGESAVLRTEELRFPISGSWNPNAGIKIVHTEPTAFTLLSIAQEISIGS